MKDNQPKTSFLFKEGHYAFFKGHLNNKYQPDSYRGKEWQRGFDRAYFENLDRITNLKTKLGITNGRD